MTITDPAPLAHRSGPPRPGARDRRGAVGLAALVAAAAAWCLVGIGRRPLWLDEALSVGATTELARTWRETGGTMGAYYALLTPWSQVSWDPAWLRGLSLLFALATLPVVHRVAATLGDRRFAHLATALTAGAWLFVRYAQEARSYALAMLLVSVGWWSLIRWVRSPAEGPQRRAWQVALTVAGALAIASHGLSGLQLAAQVATVALLADRRDRLRALVPTVAVWFACLAALTAYGAAEVANWVPPLSVDQLRELLAAFTGPSLVAQLVLGAAILAGAAVAVDTWRRDRSSDTGWLNLVVVVWALGPPTLLVVMSSARPYLLPRYVVGSVPAMAVLVALAVDRLRPRRALHAVALLVVAAVLLSARVALHHEEADDWAGAAAHVATGSRPGDGLALPAQMLRQPFDHAWHRLDTPVDPEVVSPVGPLGEVRRFYRFHGDETVLDMIEQDGPPRLWVVGAPTVSRGDTMGPFLDDGRLAGYRVVERRRFDGDVEVVLLERR